MGKSKHETEINKALSEISKIAYDVAIDTPSRLNALKFIASFNQSEILRKSKRATEEEQREQQKKLDDIWGNVLEV